MVSIKTTVIALSPVILLLIASLVITLLTRFGVLSKEKVQSRLLSRQALRRERPNWKGIAIAFLILFIGAFLMLGAFSLMFGTVHFH